MIHVDVVDPSILRITIDDPDSRNSLDTEAMGDLAAAWRRLDRSEDLRVGLLTGSGTTAFCSGANLKKLIPDIQAGRLEPGTHQEAYLKGETAMLSKPVVCAVNGDCLGGGFELMLGTDIRVAAEHARFGLPEVTLGLIPAGGGTARLPEQVPRAHAAEILLGGKLFSASHAIDIGLVNAAVPATELESTALDYATRLASNGPDAVRAVKALVAGGSGLCLEERLDRELEVAREVFAGSEAMIGVAAFQAKTTPRF